MAVSVADIKARFPEFAAVDDTYLGLVLADAETELGDAWGTKRDRAVMLLTAHLLTMEGSGAGAMAGAITSETIGAYSRSWAVLGGTVESTLDESHYGKEYRRLLNNLCLTPTVI